MYNKPNRICTHNTYIGTLQSCMYIVYIHINKCFLFIFQFAEIIKCFANICGMFLLLNSDCTPRAL